MEKQRGFPTAAELGGFDYVHALFIGSSKDPDQVKAMAIKVLDNPNATNEDRENALKFARAYKAFTESQISTPSTERAICVDQNGRRTDLKAR